MYLPRQVESSTTVQPGTTRAHRDGHKSATHQARSLAIRAFAVPLNWRVGRGRKWNNYCSPMRWVSTNRCRSRRSISRRSTLALSRFASPFACRGGDRGSTKTRNLGGARAQSDEGHETTGSWLDAWTEASVYALAISDTSGRIWTSPLRVEMEAIVSRRRVIRRRILLERGEKIVWVERR